MTDKKDEVKNVGTGQIISRDKVDINHLGVRCPRQRLRVVSCGNKPSLTKQSDKDRANIHNILRRFEKTGHLPQRVVEPLQGDIPAVSSFHEAMNIVVRGQQAFDSLPSNIRQKFENDPGKFLSFVSDEKNKDEMKEMGLLSPEKVEEIVKVSVVSPPTPPAPSAPHNAGEGQGASEGVN